MTSLVAQICKFEFENAPLVEGNENEVRFDNHVLELSLTVDRLTYGHTLYILSF